MSEITSFVQGGGALTGLWQIVVLAAVGYLLVLGVAAYVRPALSRRFLAGFAATRKANTVESLLRLLAGVAFIGASPGMRFSELFFWFGVVLAVTAVPMLLLPGLHGRYAAWAVPFAQRILPFYGAGAIGLGLFIAYALLE